jgi:hypothetical protein
MREAFDEGGRGLGRARWIRGYAIADVEDVFPVLAGQILVGRLDWWESQLLRLPCRWRAMKEAKRTDGIIHGRALRSEHVERRAGETVGVQSVRRDPVRLAMNVVNVARW